MGQGCFRTRGPAAQKPVVEGQAWGKERLFRRLATRPVERWQTRVQRLTSPGCRSAGKSFYRRREGCVCRYSAVSSDGHLEIGRRCSDRHHCHCLEKSI